jgi:hypothetical protein
MQGRLLSSTLLSGYISPCLHCTVLACAMIRHTPMSLQAQPLVCMQTLCGALHLLTWFIRPAMSSLLVFEHGATGRWQWLSQGLCVWLNKGGIAHQVETWLRACTVVLVEGGLEVGGLGMGRILHVRVSVYVCVSLLCVYVHVCVCACVRKCVHVGVCNEVVRVSVLLYLSMGLGMLHVVELVPTCLWCWGCCM